VVRLAFPAHHGPALNLLHIIFLLAAGLVAGIVGTAGGITSLISYPALLAVGLSPISANATNLVALSVCWPGSAHGSRRELAGWGPWLRRWLPLTGLGGAAGGVLLLVTPPGAFVHVVPFLIAAGSLALIAEPWLRGLRPAAAAPLRRRREAVLVVALGLLAVYGGYFGAGSGVMTLALLLVLVERDLPTANALKNMATGASTLPAGILLAFLGPVHWAAAAPLAVGALAGSRIGPAVTRALPRIVTRWAVAVLGLGLAAWLWVKPSA
jgi:uncharacterized membrane protein YfcA